MNSLPSRGGVLAGTLEFKFENNWPHVVRAHEIKREKQGDSLFARSR